MKLERDLMQPAQEQAISPALMQLMRKNNHDYQQQTQSGDPFSRIEGALSVHCHVDLQQRTVIESAAMATPFKGYEALLPGRDLQQVGRVSATASGICGGVHATASALCLEMALGIRPPPLGIVVRNLLLSCQYLNDNCMHLFVLAGPDYSQAVIEKSNPEIWSRAQHSASRFANIHGYQHIGEIMLALNKGQGTLYKEALKMIAIARQAYSLLGGKYPHSESIIPGGVSLQVDATKLQLFKTLLAAFTSYSQKTAAIWDDVFDFMLDANPHYENLGRAKASMLDFGQWDHPDYYDATYENCDVWGAQRWSTPAAVINGELRCTQLSLLNAGMEESLDYSYRERQILSPADVIRHDPKGNPISIHHPWNKRIASTNSAKEKPQAYSWGSSLTWQGESFEVGAYARLYLSAIAQKLPRNAFVASTGNSLEFLLPQTGQGSIKMLWQIPQIWNAFERNRARAYSLAFNLAVTLENIAIAEQLVNTGQTQTQVALDRQQMGTRLGVGLWGASRGFLAHWAVIKDQVIDNYQIAIPSRINVATRNQHQAMGPLEQALQNTPILETGFQNVTDFQGIDIQRTIQSFDPCMSCHAQILLKENGMVLRQEIDTSFPVLPPAHSS
ncbi:nickel-dependent hydrogenase large subunit [Undibacterium flavidum]|uniref:Uptake hydrogenase large subunit n=1 Tax=Undibacterium flavidum TaxID=2762297 RepID=A0ABR6Y825_9BURK|nr:nickel-dependent hydrogenase large subunit [Undibacterium flavidum]MBC3872757.1 nickel-dependent hydrogenase large subunit [Undibacterium flavidum]